MQSTIIIRSTTMIALHRAIKLTAFVASLVASILASSGATAFVAAPAVQKHQSTLSQAWRKPNKNSRNNKVFRQELTELNAIMDIVGTSPEPIHTAFSLATFGPQPVWLLLILLPKAEITKKTMGTMSM